MSQKGQPVRQVAIALRTAKIADAVRTLISDWRAKAAAEQEFGKQSDLDSQEYAYEQFGGSRRKRRFVRQQYAKARAAGPIAQWIMEYGETYRPPVRRVGRPRRSGMAGIAALLHPIETKEVPMVDLTDEQPQFRGTKMPVFDQDFCVHTPVRRRTKSANMDGSGFFRTAHRLDWRWCLALSIVQNRNLEEGVADCWVLRSVRFLRKRRRGSSHTDDAHLIGRAYALYISQDITKHYLEAALLTGVSDACVAKMIGLPPGLVMVYRFLFYDVDAVPEITISSRFTADQWPLNQYDRWKCAAWHGGLKALIGLWRYEQQRDGLSEIASVPAKPGA